MEKKQIYGIPSARQSNFIPNQARNKALVTYGAVRYTRIVRATNNEKLKKNRTAPTIFEMKLVILQK